MKDKLSMIIIIAHRIVSMATSVSVLLDTVAPTVKWKWMSVPPILAYMGHVG